MNELENIITLIGDNPGRGIDQLVSWARDHYRDRQLYYELVILKSRFNHAFDQDDRSRTIADIMKMIARLRELAPVELSQEPGIVSEKRNHFIQRGASNEIVIDCIDAGREYKRTGFVLKNINLQVRLGEITGVVGENGNGKTTLLKVIAGRLKNDSGKVVYNSKYIVPGSLDSLQQEIAFLPQELEPVYGKVLSSIQLAASVYGIYGEENEFEVEYIIHRLGLNDYKHVYWHELSGGYKVRFTLARIMVRRPRVLILDEPLSNLDHNAKNKLLADLRDLSSSLQHPVAIVLSSQQIDEVESVADNMVYLSKGEVLYSGPTGAIGKDNQQHYFEIGSPLTRTELSEKLKSLPQFRLEFTGVSYLLTTSTRITRMDVLDYIVKHKVPIKYLNDISNSAKSILYQMNEAII